MDKSRDISANAQHAPRTILVKYCIKSIHVLVSSEIEYLSYRLCFSQYFSSGGYSYVR